MSRECNKSQNQILNRKRTINMRAGTKWSNTTNSSSKRCWVTATMEKIKNPSQMLILSGLQPQKAVIITVFTHDIYFLYINQGSILYSTYIKTPLTILIDLSYKSINTGFFHYKPVSWNFSVNIYALKILHPLICCKRKSFALSFNLM